MNSLKPLQFLLDHNFCLFHKITASAFHHSIIQIIKTVASAESKRVWIFFQKLEHIFFIAALSGKIFRSQACEVFAQLK